MSDFQPPSDPEFGGVVAKQLRGESLLRDWSLSPAAVVIFAPVAAFVALMVLIEVVSYSSSDRLAHPMAVKNITPSALILANGRSLSLPFIKRIPIGRPIFDMALLSGVEVDGEGNAFGLLTVNASCGMTLCHHREIRINLSELAASVDPDGVDDSIVPSAVIADRRIRSYSRLTGTRVLDYQIRELKYWRDSFEQALKSREAKDFG
jgi:hypothetical protein